MIMKKQNLDYDKAYSELLKILEHLQSDDIGLEEIFSKLQRAIELTEFCKQRLREIETVVDKLKPSI